MSTSASVTSPWMQSGRPIEAIRSSTGITFRIECTPLAELVVAPAG